MPRAAAERLLKISPSIDAVLGYGFGAVAAGSCRSARTDRTVSRVKPVMMLARWNSPARCTSRGDWPKPAAARAMVASIVTGVPALSGSPSPPSAGEASGRKAEEHWDSRQIVCCTGTAGVGERIGRFWRVAGDRVSGEDGQADQPAPACDANQRRCCPAACRVITSPPACGSGHEQRPCHRGSFQPGARQRESECERN